jgi:hypothetical protein
VRVLLDECVPRRLKRDSSGMTSRPLLRWASKKNGELLTLAAVDFDTFLTSDRNLWYQQNLSAFEIAVIVLVATSNRIDDLRRSCRGLVEVSGTAKAGSVTLVRA